MKFDIINDKISKERLKIIVNSRKLRKEISMKSYICDVCGYIYDPAEGDPENGVEPGTSFDDIPEDWLCPLSGVGKEDFSPVD